MKTMNKFKSFLDFSKEEKWLEEMAEKGWQLKGASLTYKFESAPSEQVKIRIDFRDFKSNQDFNDYKTLFEDSGWKHIVGSKDSGTQYFMKTNPDADDEIFSDTASRAGRYKRSYERWIMLAMCFMPLFVVSVSSNMMGSTFLAFLSFGAPFFIFLIIAIAYHGLYEKEKKK
ncbi:MAG: DUF2812 domain-containing protein [Oscillospiraceae bacterium]|nr:DUF2812 domain-containing protein [Oscillospiraceae bacterium]